MTLIPSSFGRPKLALGGAPPRGGGGSPSQRSRRRGANQGRLRATVVDERINRSGQSERELRFSYVAGGLRGGPRQPERSPTVGVRQKMRDGLQERAQWLVKRRLTRGCSGLVPRLRLVTRR